MAAERDAAGTERHSDVNLAGESLRLAQMTFRRLVQPWPWRVADRPPAGCRPRACVQGMRRLSPESAHQVTILMSDRDTPRTWRHMHGYGSSTYMENAGARSIHAVSLLYAAV